MNILGATLALLLAMMSVVSAKEDDEKGRGWITTAKLFYAAIYIFLGLSLL